MQNLICPNCGFTHSGDYKVCDTCLSTGISRMSSHPCQFCTHYGQLAFKHKCDTCSRNFIDKFSIDPSLKVNS